MLSKGDGEGRVRPAPKPRPLFMWIVATSFHPYTDTQHTDIHQSPALAILHSVNPHAVQMDIHALGLGPAPPPAPPPAPQSPDAIPFGFPGYGGVPHPLVPTRTGRQQPFFKGQARNSKDGSPFVAGGGVGAVGGRGGRPTPVKRAGALANATRLVRGPAASTPATELDYVVSPSCSACRKAKKGCPGGSPCSRCDKLGAKCVYLTKAIRKGRLSGESVNAAVDETVIADANAVEVAVAGAVDGSVQVRSPSPPYGSVADFSRARVSSQTPTENNPSLTPASFPFLPSSLSLGRHRLGR